jgi:hypothetical protein
MTHRIFCKHAVFLLAFLAVASFLTSCSTAPTATAGVTPFKFWVLRYKPPVDAAAWVPYAAASKDPEGEALNIATSMREGDLEQWLANWQNSDRPNLSTAQSDALRREWQSLQGARFAILGRVIAEADVIVELSFTGAQGNAGKIQIPLRHANDRWCLTAIDPASEYLHWENSPNKLIEYIDPDSFGKHLGMTPAGKSKDNAIIAPAKGVVQAATF